jgi:hypothetical protein
MEPSCTERGGRGGAVESVDTRKSSLQQDIWVCGLAMAETSMACVLDMSYEGTAARHRQVRATVLGAELANYSTS